MKKIFGGINLSWKKVIIIAVILGVSVGLLNSIPALKDTTITDVATYFDFWIFCGIFIIMNAKSNKDSALKCFIFFLISQPLIYLAEVPFSHLGWQLFRYYKYWFIWTILTIPMGYIGYYIKKDKWYGLLILLPMLILLGMGVNTSLRSFIYSFPHHLINLVFVILSLIVYPLVLFNNKKIKYIGLGISIILIIIFGSKPLLERPSYETILRCSSESLFFDESYSVYLINSDYGDMSIQYVDSVKDYCLHAIFYKTGDTRLVLESPDGEKKEYILNIGDRTYHLEEIK